MCGRAGRSRTGDSTKKLPRHRDVSRDLRVVQPRVPGDHVPHLALDSQHHQRGFIRELATLVKDPAADVRSVDN